MDKLLSKKHQKNLRYKVLVGAYVAGRKLLKRRFARDIWNRLVKLIAKKSSKPKIDEEKLVQTVEKLKTSQNGQIFAQARKEMGLQESEEELNNLRQIYNRNCDEKIFDKHWKSWRVDEMYILLDFIFRHKKVTKISQIPR